MHPPIFENEPLPIDPLLPGIVDCLRAGHDLILTAPPGAGKTTRVPRALMDAGFARRGEILVLEPRRIAARLAAHRVAGEMGEMPGGRVGYSVRFEHVGGAATRIRFVTEAVLLRMALEDPGLRNIGVIILDEFHERHVATDLALALARRVQRGKRPDLRIAVMSATMDPALVAVYLPGAVALSAEGARFDLSVEHLQRESAAPLHEQVLRAAGSMLGGESAGDILVFLPGAAEIRRAADALQPIAQERDVEVHRLHGDLSFAEQDRAVAPASRRKIILSTNVAESSITIPGITAVIDSGLARIASHSPWSGLPLLRLGKISRASAAQRAGRAGRTGPGRVLRLYTRADHDARPERDPPEIRRADLADVVLTMHGVSIRDVRAFEWLEAPPEAALLAAEDLLRLLGAMTEDGDLTAVGRRMLDFPVHPRLARMILEGEREGVATDAVLLAALLSERNAGRSPNSFMAGTGRGKAAASTSSDLLEMLGEYRDSPRGPGSSAEAAAGRLGQANLQNIRKACLQMERCLDSASRKIAVPRRSVDETLRRCLLAGYPDRVARRRRPGSRELLLATGGTALLSETSGVHEAGLLVALEADERREDLAGKAPGYVRVRLASAIEEEWLAVQHPELLSEKTELRWNEDGGRAEQTQQTYYLSLLLEERVSPAAPGEAAGRLLASRLLARGIGALPGAESLGSLRCRLELLALHFPDVPVPRLDEECIRNAVERLCRKHTRMAEIESASLVQSLVASLDDRQRRLLAREAPERIEIGARRALQVHYEGGKPPWIASRLQDFFRLRKTPAICRGRVPLTVHLLAPNGRPVQVTQDLAGFWEKHYPALRRELHRRYPKHAWPEPGQA